MSALDPGQGTRRCWREAHRLEKRSVGFQVRCDGAGTARNGAQAVCPVSFVRLARRDYQTDVTVDVVREEKHRPNRDAENPPCRSIA